ncbi:E3 ubiquitin-protein ligase Kcmf1 [Drosophila erecta]|uniref:E3 ubiquitin-protein ligase Kcmf1 n=1 Tax=Drosophila erecta TaxID=7220 RepID=UPI0007327326|nr:E3 ubiquitin-protein ligase Kcmf1 [Drosophila erecta]XP_015010017.1 E3 ubiquitin-protein ligase Kcmf1 [Drosophila erecta]XP_015010022.1 E3 ubiquitin-protein ligase Kcmf1 [Drosophila erecta]XP_015010023.1 E3 ubiquitin-protein ligase Kcmf1 [Drosophila erecta]XP_026831893.1 E3 ubiquitin-protein ligase Kcmf1 [Drosophila erecta]XP_026831894.1 E3 ubiquitin-protein ligase Kcmf1 [Drosophila erecta]XP_026831895.1 E3 ubiquitin-protein ligase Kcmf1 [Drosophila erecta]XP_026831896.1 E3 ubiquitin-prot
MSRHEGVSCDSCLKSNFNGRRYKCLVCYDYDLCADCYEDSVTSTRHLVEHPMQCILTRSDIELYFGGEILTSDQPQSFTCPYCNKMGFSDATLLEHVSAEHTETSLEVVCPVCAGLPGGEPNLVTDDFAGHLTVEHRQGPRELISFLDEPSAIRHGGGVRRIPGRTLGGPRTRRSNMHFSSSSGLSALSPSGRESVDPIAELLSQLSGVRRGGPPTSQLQQLQMQMQLDRQQVTASRQIDRLPRRAHPIVSTSNSNAAMAEVINGGTGGSGGSGAVGSGSGGGSGATAPPNLRTEWPVTASFSTSASNHSQTQSSLAANSLNAREAIGTSSSAASNVLGISVGVGGTANGNGGAGSSGVGTGAGGAGQTGGQGGAAAGESLLLAQFMQPTFTEAEWAIVESMRADRSMFVQSLMLSMLCTEALDLNASDESLAKSDNVNKGQQQQQEDAEAEAQAETLLNNNADVEQQQQQPQQAMVRQVNQMQQTSPEDFVCDEYRYKNKKANTTQTSGTGGGGIGGVGGGLGGAGATAAPGGGASGAGTKPTADRGIERRSGRPPPGEMATGSQQPQQQQQQSTGNPAASQQKYKQNANAATAANTNQIPDTR